MERREVTPFPVAARQLAPMASAIGNPWLIYKHTCLNRCAS